MARVERREGEGDCVISRKPVRAARQYSGTAWPYGLTFVPSPLPNASRSLARTRHNRLPVKSISLRSHSCKRNFRFPFCAIIFRSFWIFPSPGPGPREIYNLERFSLRSFLARFLISTGRYTRVSNEEHLLPGKRVHAKLSCCKPIQGRKRERHRWEIILEARGGRETGYESVNTQKAGRGGSTMRCTPPPIPTPGTGGCDAPTPSAAPESTGYIQNCP